MLRQYTIFARTDEVGDGQGETRNEKRETRNSNGKLLRCAWDMQLITSTVARGVCSFNAAVNDQIACTSER